MAIDLSGGRNTRALYGVCLCGAAINQITKGRGKDEKEGSELHFLAAASLVKNYKQRSLDKAPLVISALKQMKAFSS